MADDSVVVDDNDHGDNKIVTKFLFITCRLLQPSIYRLQAAVMCCMKATKQRDDDETHFPLITGSSAELYIEPMLLCVGDIDIMFHSSDVMAIPDGYIHRRQIYQLNFTAVSRATRLWTVSTQDTCTWCGRTY